jgi:AcrR family transcriptional regulator
MVFIFHPKGKSSENLIFQGLPVLWSASRNPEMLTSIRPRTKIGLLGCNIMLTFTVTNDHQSFTTLELILGTHERKEREKEQRREDILDAAQRVFFDRGLAVATMDDIAETAELSKGTLYLYYKSKEDLYLTVMMRGMQLLYDGFSQIATSGASAAKMLSRLSEGYLDYFNAHRDYFRMMHYLQSPQFHKQISEEVKQSCSVLNQRIWDLVNGVLQRCIDEGLLRKDLNPADVGLILWSSATALMLRIDNEEGIWRGAFRRDLHEVLKLSNALLLDAICTEKGRLELKASSNS